MLKKIVLKSIRFYQVFISPNFRKVCRFYPSCSHYFYQSVEKYGVVKGIWRGLKRITRCHPWNPGGIDQP